MLKAVARSARYEDNIGLSRLQKVAAGDPTPAPAASYSLAESGGGCDVLTCVHLGSVFIISISG